VAALTAPLEAEHIEMLQKKGEDPPQHAWRVAMQSNVEQEPKKWI